MKCDVVTYGVEFLSLYTLVGDLAPSSVCVLEKIFVDLLFRHKLTLEETPIEQIVVHGFNNNLGYVLDGEFNKCIASRTGGL